MLQAWKKRNVPFYDSEDLFFFPKLLSFYMTACKKNSAANKTGKNVFSALCEQTDFIM